MLLVLLVLLSADRPAGAQPTDIPQSRMLPITAANDLSRLIDARDANLQTNKVFKSHEEIVKVRPEFQRLRREVLAADKVRRLTQADLDRVAKQVTGQAGRGMQARVETARQAAAAAARNHESALNAFDRFKKAKIDPWQNNIDAAMPQWVDVYSQMRQLVPADRQDPETPAIAAVYSRTCARSPNFVEGYVLGAITAIYDDKIQAAEESLKEAEELIEKFELGDMLVTADFCYACLLLGRPKLCEGCVKYLKQIAAAGRTVEQDAALGLYGYATGKLHEGRSAYRSAYQEQAKLRRKDGPEAPVALWGDAAMLLLQVDDDLSRILLDKADPDGRSGEWQVLRARATIAARDNDWQRAVDLLEVCVDRAPATMRDELLDQLDACKNVTDWNVREFRGKKRIGGNAAGGPEAAAGGKAAVGLAAINDNDEEDNGSDDDDAARDEGEDSNR